MTVAMEFSKEHSTGLKERSSDNVELPKLFNELPHVNPKNRDRFFSLVHSTKARVLVHAHLTRLPLTDELAEGLCVYTCLYVCICTFVHTLVFVFASMLHTVCTICISVFLYMYKYVLYVHTFIYLCILLYTNLFISVLDLTHILKISPKLINELLTLMEQAYFMNKYQHQRPKGL